MSQMDCMEQHPQRNAICELIDANIHLLETLKKQFIVYKIQNKWSYPKHYNPKAKLHKLEQQDKAFLRLLGMVESTLQTHDSGLRQTIHQVQQARSLVAESCCFISKLPNELLRDILRRASVYIGTLDNSARQDVNYAPYVSLQLASVCRRWRAVATSIPSLWTEITLAPGSHQSARQKEFWQTISIYTKDTPVNISISDSAIVHDLIRWNKDLWEGKSYDELADYGYIWDAVDHMHLYELQSLSAINSISIEIEFESELQRLLLPKYENVACRCNKLSLKDTRDRGSHLYLRLSDLLYHFDAKVVTCAYACGLDPGKPIAGRSLTELHLFGVESIPLDDLLKNYTEITALRCTGSTLKWGMAQSLIHSNLRKLKLGYTKNSKICRWLDYLHCPALIELDAAGWANDKAFIDFIDRSPQIKSTFLGESDEPQVLRLVSHLPNVESLKLSSDTIGLLYSWTSYHLSRPPFPLLEALYLRKFDGEKHTLLPLIRERCLTPGSTSGECSSKLDFISVEVVNGQEIVESALRDSDIADLVDVEWIGKFIKIEAKSENKASGGNPTSTLYRDLNIVEGAVYSLMNGEQRSNALCELINTNIHLLETLKKQFVAHKIENEGHHLEHENTRFKLHELEAQDNAFLELLGMVEFTLKTHGSGLRKALDDVQRARSRIAESCCFISKLPNELLHDILRRASDYGGTMYNGAKENVNYAPYFSLQLASVCRRWRANVISIPSLWTKIELALGSHQSARRDGFWETIRSYTRNIPVDISITDRDICNGLFKLDKSFLNLPYEDLVFRGGLTNVIEQLMCGYDLRGLTAVNSILIEMKYEPNIQRLLEPKYQNLDCRCNTLRLEGKDSRRDFDAKLDNLLYHFDAKVVKCSYIRILELGQPLVGRSLREIHLYSIYMIRLDHLLTNYTEITVLRCNGSTLKWRMMQTLVHSKLQSLELGYTKESKNCRWLDYLRCPALTELDTEGWANDNAFIDFLSHSPLINSIGLEKSDEQGLLSLVRHLPGVELLGLLPDAIGALYNWTSYHRSGPPFPLLKSLYIYKFDGEKHALLPLIRERCLAPHVSSKGIKHRMKKIVVEVTGGRGLVESMIRDSGIADMIDAKWEGRDLEIKFKSSEN